MKLQVRWTPSFLGHRPSSGFGRKGGTALIVLFSFLIGTLSELNAAIYFVSPAGSDLNPGTQSQPWRSIQHAAKTASAGDTVRVGAGTYDETVKTINPGKQEARITFDGQGAAIVRRFWVNKPYITLTGFTLTGDPVPGSSAIQLEDGAHYTLLTKNVIDTKQILGVSGIQMSTDVFSDPADTNAPRHCLILSNSIGNIFGAAAVQLSGRYNTFKLNTITNIYTADFMRLFGHKNVIQQNRFQNNLYREGSGYHPDFIQTFGELKMASVGHLIEGNIVSNIENGQLCQLTMVNSFYDGQHGGWIFRNNIFADIALQASVGIPEVYWLNNTFIRCNYLGGHALALGYTEGRGNANGGLISNNIFLDCGRPESDNLGWYGVEGVSVLADYNFVAKNNYQPVRQAYPASAFRWYEPHGINGGNPKFANEAALDLRLLSGSPLIDKGEAIGDLLEVSSGGRLLDPVLDLTESLIGDAEELLTGVSDAAGILRPQGQSWDIGAFEFSQEAAVDAPTPPGGLRFSGGF